MAGNNTIKQHNMENTTQTEFRQSIAKLRTMIKLIKESIDRGYLRMDYKEDKGNNYESIVLTESGYYAFSDDCVVAEDEYYHEVEDEDEYQYDEIDECYEYDFDDPNWRDDIHDEEVLSRLNDEYELYEG
jgi:tRNA G26 N,N-dimethylase Trm1